MVKTIFITAMVFGFVYLGYRSFRYFSLSNGLKVKIAQGAIILDVRTASEYHAGHIDGAINISLGSIRERYKELDPRKTYITYCSHGLRSVKAQKILESHGFKQVYNGGAIADLEKVLFDLTGR